MTSLVTNRKATFNYEILERFEAGVELFGHEVKALRQKMANLAGAYVTIRDNEVFLRGAHISPYQTANTPADYNPERERKLLLTKKEINKLQRELNTAGLTIVPIKWYSSGRNIKLEIALVRGKKKADKRESIKARDTKRDLDRELKHR